MNEHNFLLTLTHYYHDQSARELRERLISEQHMSKMDINFQTKVANYLIDNDYMDITEEGYISTGKNVTYSVMNDMVNTFVHHGNAIRDITEGLIQNLIDKDMLVITWVPSTWRGRMEQKMKFFIPNFKNFDLKFVAAFN